MAVEIGRDRRGGWPRNAGPPNTLASAALSGSSRTTHIRACSSALLGLRASRAFALEQFGRGRGSRAARCGPRSGTGSAPPSACTIAPMNSDRDRLADVEVDQPRDEQQRDDEADRHRAGDAQAERGVDHRDAPVEDAQLPDVAVMLGPGRARVERLERARAVDDPRQPARPARSGSRRSRRAGTPARSRSGSSRRRWRGGDRRSSRDLMAAAPPPTGQTRVASPLGNRCARTAAR